jgi:NADH-quinone oxidoreductase subunit N
VAASETGLKGLLVYLVAYLFMNLGAFYVATLIHDAEGTFDVRDYAGLSRRAPFLTLAMSIFLLSLMGMPPLVGFMGKLYVFAAVLEKGLGAFATLAAVNVAVAAYYYFRVLRAMVIDAAEGAEAPLRLATADGALLVLLTLANVVPLLFWSRIEAWTAASAVLGASR